MILEWDNPWQLIPSVNYADTAPGLGPLPFNSLISVETVPLSVETVPLGYLMLDPAKCMAGAARRITRNNLAQANGEITHRKFKSGYVIELNCQLWQTLEPGVPACAGALRELADVLAGYLEAAANNDAQLVWQPSGWPVDPVTGDPLGPLPNPRLLDRARSMGPSGNDAGGSGSGFVSVVTEKDPGSPLTDVTFAFLSALPYVTDYMNWPTSPDEIVSFATLPSPGIGVQAPDARVTVVNAGNVEYQPILRINGPASYCAIVNYSATDEVGNPLQIVYDSTLRGAFAIPDGSYIEIDTFRSTARMFNPGSGTDNAKSCIDVLRTDFFSLVPGNNNLFVNKEISLSDSFYDGDGVDVIYRNAWA